MEAVVTRKLIENTWFELCKIDDFAKTLLYAQIPNYYTYDKRQKKFKNQKKGFSLGRINYALCSLEDSYYLCVLLNVVRGPTSYEDIKTFEGVVHESYKKACFARGLLDEDHEYIDDLVRRSYSSSALEIRDIFVMMFLNNTLANPETVWENTWEILSEDIEYN